MRFPIFPSSSRGLLGRGEDLAELVLWRPEHGVTRHVFGGAVVAATYIKDFGEWIIALVDTGGMMKLVEECLEEVPRFPNGLSFDRDWRAVARDFEIADDDLSPLYLHMDEPGDSSVYFRTGDTWRYLHKWGAGVHLHESSSPGHLPARHPWHMKHHVKDEYRYGPDRWFAAVRDRGWTAWQYYLDHGDHVFFDVPAGEDVLALALVAAEPMLLTRAGDTVRLRSGQGLRLEVGVEGPLVRHLHAPWFAWRSSGMIKIFNYETGEVEHRVPIS